MTSIVTLKDSSATSLTQFVPNLLQKSYCIVVSSSSLIHVQGYKVAAVQVISFKPRRGSVYWSS
jgi:hypothetical protein